MKILGTILRWFTLGAIAGLLVAPRAGDATRRLITDKLGGVLDGRPDDLKPVI